jgi:hypothetical protein
MNPRCVYQKEEDKVSLGTKRKEPTFCFSKESEDLAMDLRNDNVMLFVVFVEEIAFDTQGIRFLKFSDSGIHDIVI